MPIAVLLLSLCSSASATDSGPGALYTKATYPAEITLRPLTLPRGMLEVSAGGGTSPSSGTGSVTYANGGPTLLYGATDDVRIEVDQTTSVCLDCPPWFRERGVGGAAFARVSVLRSDPQQLAVAAGASTMNWAISGRRTSYEARVLHVVAAGSFGLLTTATVNGGDARVASLSVNPQVQLTRALHGFIAGSISVPYRSGGLSQRSIPLGFGVSATVDRRPLALFDVGVGYTWTNPLDVGTALPRHAVNGWAQVLF